MTQRSQSSRTAWISQEASFLVDITLKAIELPMPRSLGAWPMRQFAGERGATVGPLDYKWAYWPAM